MKNVLRTLIFNEQVSLTVADTTRIVEEGRRRHVLSETSALVFGRAISAMTFMSACLKQETGEISLSFKSDGTCEEIAVSGNRKLYMRGYIGNTQAECDEKTCFGRNGSLTVIRDDGYNRPFVGSCALPENADTDAAFEEYYRISEQLPTRIKTGVKFAEDGRCVFAGVVAVQPLPFADEATLKKVESLDLEKLLCALETENVETLVKARFDADKAVWDLRDAEYRCNCSREYLSQVLVSLGEEQMRQIIREDGNLKVHCHYCNTDYEFTEKDADEIFKKNGAV